MRKAVLELADAFISALSTDAVSPAATRFIEPIGSEGIIVIGLAGIASSTYMILKKGQS
ncbi:MAG: hypothetical protein ACLP5H_33020 [Desulfomonilaceae bacterium]